MAESNWQPIDSAPKDGTLIVLHGYFVVEAARHRRGKDTFVSSWADQFLNGGAGWVVPDTQCGDFYTVDDDPDFLWAPIPPLPTPPQAEGGE